jgi:hypothetical protein
MTALPAKPNPQAALVLRRYPDTPARLDAVAEG